MTATNNATDPYARALEAEPDLWAAERLVDLLCDLVRPTDHLCAGCVWELILKPLIEPCVGWCRDETRRARDPFPEGMSLADQMKACMINGDEFVNPTPKPVTGTERWLRTSAAYDVVTDRWLAKLDEADPGTGHGMGRTAHNSQKEGHR